MKVRVILVCTLLLLAAVPTFALPLCAECIVETNSCEELPGSFERCKFDFVTGLCYTTPQLCSPPRAQSTVLSDYTVASVEISQATTECVTAAVTDVPTSAPRTSELK